MSTSQRPRMGGKGGLGVKERIKGHGITFNNKDCFKKKRDTAKNCKNKVK